MQDAPELTGVQPENLDANIPAETEVKQDSKTFTQDDVDRIVRDRLRRERERIADLESKAKRWDEFEQSQKSELELAQERLAQSEARAAALESQFRDAMVRNEIVSSATYAGFMNPQDAIRMIEDYGTITFDDSGKPVGIKEAVEALAKDKPYLLRQTPAATSRIGATNPATSVTNTPGADWSHLFSTSGRNPFGSKG